MRKNLVLKAILALIFTMLLSASVFAEVWKDVSDGIEHDKEDLIKLDLMQFKINDLDIAQNKVKLMIMNGNGDFQEMKTLGKNEVYTYKGLVKIKATNFNSEPFDQVTFKMELLVNAEIEEYEFPEELEVGINFQRDFKVINTGAEPEKFKLVVIPDAPYLKSERPTQKILNPQALNQRLEINVVPQEATNNGAVTINLMWEDEVLESVRVENIVIKDNSDGFIDELKMPRILLKGKTYYGQSDKVTISVTNNADISSKLKVVFTSPGIKFDTGSKYGDDVLAENIGPHITKLLYIPSFTAVKAGEQEITVDLYSNGRIVDKLVKTVMVEGYVDDFEEVEEEEEVTIIDEQNPESNTNQEVIEEETVKEETNEGNLITGNAIADTPETSGSSSNTTKLLLALVVILCGVVMYQRVFKPKKDANTDKVRKVSARKKK